MSPELERARVYEEENEKRILPEERPMFHLSPRVGWLNDPNGFSYYNGLYHLFYQYYPYDSHWGAMHWGHAVSDDLIRWRYLPAALAPDMPYDRDGCFSGGAVTAPDGRQLLMYTGVRKEKQPDGQIRDVQTQNLAFGDGKDYEKYDLNPVLTAEDIPEGGSRFDFRDPKLWRCPDGSYRALTVNRHEDGSGQALLYRSEDGLHWHFDRTVARNRNRIGVMWECPDCFRLDGWDVLLASAMDMLPKDFEYHNGNGTFCLLGREGEKENGFENAADFAVDYGIDFYAPQTLLSPDGRRIMIAWMQNWDTCNLRTKSRPWFGQMSLPRELSVRNGRLFQTPIRELEKLRCCPAFYENVVLRDGELTLPGVKGRTVDLEVELKQDPEGEPLRLFRLRFAANEQHYTDLLFTPEQSILQIDRKFSGSRRAIIHQRRAKVRHCGGALKLRLILDRFSAEVFINDGEQVMSATLYTDPEPGEIRFYAEGSIRMDVRKYGLKSAE